MSAFNPASVVGDYVVFPVRHGHYDVSAYDFKLKNMVAVTASVICENVTLTNGYPIKTCVIHVDYPIDSMQVGLIQLKYNSKTDLSVTGIPSQTTSFDTQTETISVTGYDQQYGISLKTMKKVNNQTIRFNADIRYWPSFGDDDYQSSGAYIFRVENGTSESIRYSQF